MNKLFFLIVLFFLFDLSANAQTYLKKQGTTQQLYVQDKPFLVLGGELSNSAASDKTYMEYAWPKVKKLNVNTVLAPIYWELMEPREGKFEFDLVDDLIENARKNQIKLVFLWFGAWKNSMTCYAPAWVKTDVKRFPRALSKDGKPQEILSPFYENNLQADIKAFAALMKHIKGVDSKEQTVVMIQVENEIGMLPDARDYSLLANQRFVENVPAGFTQYLTSNEKDILPELKSVWEKGGLKKLGTWEQLFGKSLATDEIFMAWYYAQFIEKLTAAGKEQYNIPMFLNAALNYKREAKPGEYPSAGPLPHIMDVWKAGAPSVDFLSPDFYNPDFKYWNDLYVRANNPLFIPEIKFEQGVAGKAFYALGHYNGMGFSPFSIETGAELENREITESYKLLSQLSPLILKYRGLGNLEGVLFDKQDKKKELKYADYTLSFSHDLSLGWSGKSKDEVWPLTGAMIIKIAENEFIVAGTGVVATFKTNNGKTAGILSVDELKYKDGELVNGLRLNGDQNHQGRHLRIPEGNFSIQRVKLYNY